MQGRLFGAPERSSALDLPEKLLMGTSSFSSPDWRGTFYPRGLPSREMLAYYATRYRTVEIDATYYAIPSVKTVKGWRASAPPGFEIATKAPGIITHDKRLLDCGEELAAYLAALDELGDRAGPILLQFPHFKKSEMTPAAFAARLAAFLPLLPADRKFAVEVRNKEYADERLLELLRSRGIAFALLDHPHAERPRNLFERVNPVTADFAYVRWLGDRHAIEAATKTWDKTIIDRAAELAEWAEVIARLLALRIKVYTYANNHYGGHAPDTIALFERLFRKREHPSTEG